MFPLDEVLFLGVLFTALAAACYADIRWGKIPDVISYPLAAVGLALAVGGQGNLAGVPSWSSSLAGGALAFGVFLLPVLGKGFGRGDLKLMTAVGFWFGFPQTLTVIFCVGLLGAILAVGVCLVRGVLVRAAARSASALALFRWKFAPEGSVSTVPYGVAIAAGTALAWIVGRV